MTRLIFSTLIGGSLMFSCLQKTPDDSRSKEIFNRHTRFLASEGKFLLNQVEARMYSAPIAKIYFQLGKKLDSVFYSEIDTTLQKYSASNLNLDSSGKLLATKYNGILDATKQSFGHPLFLKDEEPFVYMKNPADSLEKNDYMNFVRNAQVLHLQSLRILRTSYADYTDAFSMLKNTGSTINTNSDDKKTTVRLSFRTYVGGGKYTPLGGVKLLTSDDKTIPIENKKLNGDTVSFDTKKLSPGNYKAVADYIELSINGYKGKTEIEFPIRIER